MPEDATIRPFKVGFPETELTDLRSRVNATRWPEVETVTDDSQGAPLAMMQDLARYWATDYDWRKCEAKLNDLPHFVTEIDGLDIHFIHVRSQHPDALPLIVTHGWPGSVIERLPRRALSSPAELGRARVFRQPHPLQQARPRRPLRGVGTAGPVHRGNAGRVPVIALEACRRVYAGLGSGSPPSTPARKTRTASPRTLASSRGGRRGPPRRPVHRCPHPDRTSSPCQMLLPLRNGTRHDHAPQLPHASRRKHQPLPVGNGVAPR